MKTKIAIIGCGSIAEFHIKSLKAVGLEIIAVAGKKNSIRAKNFAKKYKIKDIWKNPLDLVKQKSPYVDGFVIAIPINDETTIKYLKIILKNKIPALFEKPLVINYKKILQFKNKSKNIVLGYNRRFYKSVQMAKLFIQKNNPLLVQVEIPEYQNSKIKNKFLNLFTNSIHIIDLLQYLFGDLKIISKSKISLKKNQSIVANCISKNGDLLNLTFNFNASAKFNIKIDSNENRFYLNPIEIAYSYKGVKKITAIGNKTIAQYKPILVKKFLIPKYEMDYKPGFYKQAIEFKKLINGKNSKISGNINDVISNLVFINNLIN